MGEATPTVTLRDVRDPLGTRWLSARLTGEGDLIIEGLERGRGVENAFAGVTEYEWSWTVRRGDLAQLARALNGPQEQVLELLARSFSGGAAAGLRAFLDGHRIPVETWSRVGD